MRRIAVAISFCLLGSSVAAGELGIRCVGRKCSVPRATVDAVLEDLPALARDVRAVPSMRDGDVHGFRLSSIRPRSVFAKVGLRNGDVVTTVNGHELSSAIAGVALYYTLRNVSQLLVGIERRSKPTTLEISIR